MGKMKELDIVRQSALQKTLTNALEAVLEAAQKQQESDEEDGQDAWASACAAVELQAAIDTVRVAQAKERFIDGDHDDLPTFKILFEHYQDEMPHGTQKGHDGDPYEWINDKILDEVCAECGGLNWAAA